MTLKLFEWCVKEDKRNQTILFYWLQLNKNSSLIILFYLTDIFNTVFIDK